jgi:biotin operon repressor
MPKFNLQERNILSVLYAAEKLLTTETIARLAGISRITVRKYLNSLREKGILRFKELNKGIYWWIAVDQRVKEKVGESMIQKYIKLYFDIIIIKSAWQRYTNSQLFLGDNSKSDSFWLAIAMCFYRCLI